ncbi:MAG: hypothetical protein M1820_000361 [Bogoriella megaspora]|nr:MAG: hypothetical protein M1820_000361 [Bogoriella megaspora]
MSIPNARESPPPPLPPPRHISELSNGHDPGWQWGNNSGFGRTHSTEVKPGSSLLGFWPKRNEKFVHDEDSAGVVLRRGSSVGSSSTVKLEHDFDPSDDTGSIGEDNTSASSSALNYRLRSERQLEQKTLENSSQAYDKHLLSRIGGPNTPKWAGNHISLSTNPQDVSASNGVIPGFPQSPLANAERNHSGDAALSRWSSVSSGPASPRNSGPRSSILDQAAIEFGRTRRLGSASTAGTADEAMSHRGSYDQSVFSDHDFQMDDSGMKELNINDRSPSLAEDMVLVPKAGQKRRADSPQREPPREERSSISSTGGASDLFSRRSIQQSNFAARNSPSSRFHTHHGSVSSTSSLGPRNGSFASSYGLSVASSATSYSSERADRLSPSALSPAADADFGPTSPYASSRSLNPSPRGSLSATHQHSGSESGPSQRSGGDGMPPSNLGKMQGVLICECCPKKPRKFDTEEELRSHTAEKQYSCAYCPNRFKNKNEAERHQNSLHLRKHSWSCNALTGPEAAFTPAANPSSAADVCGYCGEEFPTPPNWAARSEHLNRIHKYLECNQTKKFYRADHFRQHLKHSHAGTSGKWTNMLENACMRDEPPPKERIASVSTVSGSVAGLSPGSNSAGPSGGGGFMAPPATMTAPSSSRHAVIDESHEES